tara:strand:- start:127 stop:567 length:441 start_codon:yes stop_codon:yes gene_type:complete
MAINYSILGRCKNEDAVNIYICNLLKALKIHRLSSKNIEIEFKNRLESDAQGFCFGDKSQASIQIARRSSGQKMSFLIQMQTLAHELTHAKQFLRGELDYDEDGNFTWMNKSANGYKYNNQPWEKEASKQEKALFLECFPFHLDIR